MRSERDPHAPLIGAGGQPVSGGCASSREGLLTGRAFARGHRYDARENDWCKHLGFRSQEGWQGGWPRPSCRTAERPR